MIDDTEQSCNKMKQVDKLIKQYSINSKRVGIPEDVVIEEIAITLPSIHEK